MQKSCSTKGMIIGGVRILLGLAMLYFGGMKLLNTGNAEMVQMVGGAGHELGLTFLSASTWFWIAMIGELVAGILLLLGHRAKHAAIIVLIVMVFAINAQGFELTSILVSIAALIVLLWGPGGCTICKCKACKCDGKPSTKGPSSQFEQQQQQ